MIPELNSTPLIDGFEIDQQPSHTYKIIGDRIGGFVDGLEAVKQAVYLILETERFENPIYSWDYGCEFSPLFGQAPALVYAKLSNEITEALLQDDRIEDVQEFYFENQNGKIKVFFEVQTQYGQLEIEKEVAISV